MPSLREVFVSRAAELHDCAVLEVSDNGLLRLSPRNPDAVAVLLNLVSETDGSVELDDRAAVPVELGADAEEDRRAVECLISLAVEGRATAYHLGRGGCIEERHGEGVHRSWRNCLPLPGWRHRAERVDFAPYR